MARKSLTQPAFAAKKFFQLMARLSKEELEKWEKGEMELLLKPRRVSVVAPVKLSTSPEEYPALRDKLYAASSRTACEALVDSNLPKRGDMAAFAKFMGWHAPSGYSKERLRRNIVENTAGAKLDSDAIQSHFS